MTSGSFWAAVVGAIGKGSSPSVAQAPRCSGCHHFRGDALFVENQTPGLQTLSSGFAAVRAGDGICSVHLRYLSANARCDRFQARAEV